MNCCRIRLPRYDQYQRFMSSRRLMRPRADHLSRKKNTQPSVPGYSAPLTAMRLVLSSAIRMAVRVLRREGCRSSSAHLPNFSSAPRAKRSENPATNARATRNSNHCAPSPIGRKREAPQGEEKNGHCRADHQSRERNTQPSYSAPVAFPRRLGRRSRQLLTTRVIERRLPGRPLVRG